MPGDKQPSLATRTEAFVRQVVMPACAHMLDPVAPLQDRLTTKYVRAVFQAWDTQLRDIFGCYSKADRRTVAAERHLAELNVSEVRSAATQAPVPVIEPQHTTTDNVARPHTRLFGVNWCRGYHIWASNTLNDSTALHCAHSFSLCWRTETCSAVG